MVELIIKSDQDVEDHFTWHEKEKERVREVRSNFDGDFNSKEYDQIVADYDRNDFSYGEFALSFDKIVMYYGHEGDVISGIQYCPFCGIHFKVVVD